MQSGMMGAGSTWRTLRTDRSVASHRLRRETVRRVLAFARPHHRLIAIFLGVTIVDAATVVVTPLLVRHIVDDGILAGDRSIIT